MKGNKIFNMHASKVVILPKKFFKHGYLDEKKPIYFTVIDNGKILLEQKEQTDNKDGG